MWNTYSIENANVQKFIKSTGLHYDLIVAEEFFIDSFYMFAHKHKVPIVTICKFKNVHKLYVIKSNDFLRSTCISGSISAMEFLDSQQGLFQWPSFVPHWVRFSKSTRKISEFLLFDFYF